jgi:hypothetical protein
LALETPVQRSREFWFYHLGATAQFACQYDQRFSYCLYVPRSYDPAAERRYPLAVIVHGTSRTNQTYRDRFADFANAHDCIILAPLFPCGIGEPGEMHGYKWIASHGIRYDDVLLALIEEIGDVYRLAGERFLLHGFSGGGHFAHRFFYLHPKRLLGVSIGAPGVVTLLDETRDWWIGVRNLDECFGVRLDYEELRRVPVHMVIGANDTETWEITIPETSRLWMPGANDAGVTRLDRLQSLRESFVRAHIAVQYDVVPDCAHEGYRVLDPVKAFFASTLAQ